MQDNTDRKFNEPRNQINKQNEYFIKVIKTEKKNQKEILDIKNSILTSCPRSR